jgi:hypothetical protein
LSKETYECQKRPKSVKRDIRVSKETKSVKRDLRVSKET